MPPAINEIGNQYGRLTVLKRTKNYITPKGKHSAQWLCQCDCGNKATVRGDYLRNGNTKSCGCINKEKVSEARLINEVGNRYEKLTVIERAEDSKDNKVQWLCQCDCGNTHVVYGYLLRSGGVKSCGCLSFKNEIGNKYNKLTVIRKYSERNSNGEIKWVCRCDCGNEAIVNGSYLRLGMVKSCGCLLYRVGENSPSWRGGIANKPYDVEFTEAFKEKIRSRDNRFCQICGVSEEEEGQALAVHHIDYDKENSVQENCISLCVSCHMKTNHNREFWRDKLIEFMREKYG